MPTLTPLLLALGLTEFSLHPATLLEVRRAIRGCDLGALRARTGAAAGARPRRHREMAAGEYAVRSFVGAASAASVVDVDDRPTSRLHAAP